jgi:hypothetical protein
VRDRFRRPTEREESSGSIRRAEAWTITARSRDSTTTITRSTSIRREATDGTPRPGTITAGTGASAAAAAVAVHAGAADPHPGYLTPAEGNASYAAAGHNHAGVYDPAGTAATAVAAHAAAGDPHPGYLTPTEANAAYSALGHGHVSTEISDFETAVQDLIDAGGGGGGEHISHAILFESTGGAASGSFTAGADRTRTLNTEVDPDGIVTLSGNQFTLVPGDWIIEWWCPAERVKMHTGSLWSITANARVAYGQDAATQDGDLANTVSRGIARVVVAADTTYEIRHICFQTRNTTGFGYVWYGGILTMVHIHGVMA